MADDSSEDWMSAPQQIEGVSLNGGVALGCIVFHQASPALVAQEKLDSVGELSRLDEALGCLAEEILSMIQKQNSEAVAREILDVYLALANDPSWKRQLRNKVQAGASALEAVDETMEAIRHTFGASHSLIWQERITDFEDLSYRLKRHLTGISIGQTKSKKPFVLVVDRLGPAELMDYDCQALEGLVLGEGAQTSHVAIMARSLGIPVIGVSKDKLQKAKAGDLILLDGNKGRIYVHPTHQIITRYESNLLQQHAHISNLAEIQPNALSETLDGVPISLHLNAGLVEDIDHIKASGAMGVGLYRTEISFMMQSRLPNVSEQTQLYREILDRAGNSPVVFRTLDVGGDKLLPYLERLKAEDPVMSWRAIRVFLDRPILLRYQLKALIRACADRDLMIMLPMIAEVSEFLTARNLLSQEIFKEQAKGNRVPQTVKLGVMIEIPSIVYQLSYLIPHVDFVSVGSNDLFQFFYAIDREHPNLSDRYDVLSPTFLCLLKTIQEQCQAAKIPLSICGEMAGRPLEALALIGLGFRNLSMSAAAIARVKSMICSLSLQEITDYMSTVCVPSHGSIRQNLRHFARDHGIVCE